MNPTPRILGWIPARANSQGVPGKNKRILGDRPLIVHAIAGAQQAACLDHIMVSTDDSEIARLARSAGADVPWMRPENLATDESPVIESVLYDLRRLEDERDYRPDALMLLQATSPFRAPKTIRAAAEMFAQSGGESVVTVSPAQAHPYWCRRVAEDGTLEPFLADVKPPPRRQELPSAYRLDGVVYVASIKTISSQHAFYSARTRALVISSEQEALDIDTPFDWLVAEALWHFSNRGEAL